MSEPQTTPRPSFGRRLGKAFGWLLRFTLRIVAVLVIGAALGGALYFGFLFLYQQYVQPVAVNSLRLDIMTDQQGQVREQLSERLAELQQRMDALDVQRDRDKETIAGLQTQLAAAEQAQADQGASLSTLAGMKGDLAQAQSQLASMEEALDAAQAAQSALEALQAAQATLAADVATWQDAQGGVDDDLQDVRAAQASAQAALQEVQAAQSTLQQTLAEMQAQLEALDVTVTTSGDELLRVSAELQGENSPAALLRDLQLVRAMELLNRSRLLLVQNNLGLARSDIALASSLLTALQDQVPVYQVDALAAIVALLDQALGNLPGAPVTAADQIDGAWELLVAGLPGEPPPTETPEVVVETTPPAEATPVVEGTPAVVETPAAGGTPVAEGTPTPETTPAPETTPTAEATPAAEATPTEAATPAPTPSS